MIKKPAQIVQRLVSSVQRLVFIFLLFVVCCLLFVVSPAGAQAPNTNPDVPNNLHTWTQNVMIETMSALTCQLTGIDPVNPNQKCLGIDQKNGKLGFVEGGGGAIGLMGNLIAITYTPPLHTGDYFRYLADNFGLTKPAYAQSVGFEGLKPLIGLWAAFRNIVYLLFVLVFVIIGLAIMLRVKIDPRTVMTIENQIPKIIIGLLLVTFSFAIAGFLIDIMYVVIYLVFNIISGTSPAIASSVQNLNPATLQGQNAIGAVNGFLGINYIASTIANNAKSIMQNLLNISGGVGIAFPLNVSLPSISFIPPSFSGGELSMNWNFLALDTNHFFDWIIHGLSVLAGINIGAKVSNIIGVPIVQTVGGLAAGAGAFAFAEAILREAIPFIIIYLIIFIAVLWALFRLWFALIQAYVFILIDVVFAPFWILGGLLPGSPVSFEGWLRDILANLSAFPTTILLFLLGKVFIDAFSQNSQTSQPLFVPPLIGNPSGGNASPLGAIIGLGIILLAPQVVNMMKDAFKPPPFKYAGAIGQAIGAGPGVAWGAINAVFSPYGGLAMMRRAGAAFSVLGTPGGIKEKLTGFAKAATGADVPPPKAQTGTS